MRRRSASVLLLLVVARAGAQPASQPAAPPPPSPMAAYFNDLARLGIIDPKSGNQDSLEAELRSGELALERGDLANAAATFYGIVESPRYADYSDDIAYQNAEYDLIVALAGGGAYDESLGYADRVLRRGPKAHYFAVAHRRAVDIALETRRYAEVLSRLEAVPLTEPLPPEAQGERGYLVGRAAYEAGDFDLAEKELMNVSRKSRLFSSAIYIRGVIRVRQGKLKEAVDIFCEIAKTPDTDKYTFYVDDRYFGLKDLAQLGAGRIAHEEKRYDDAYYHYFQIPDDSDRLPEALFESAWSMYQKRELRTARDLDDAFLKQFPTSPLVPEAMLLGGYIELADCKFAEARKKFDALSADVRPLVDAIEKARASVELRKQILSRALDRASRRGPNANPTPLTNNPDDRVLAMLRLDPPLVRLNDAVAGLGKEAEVAPHAIDVWRDLGYRIATGKGQVAGTTDDVGKAVLLVAEVRHLRSDIRREKAALLAGVQGGSVANGRGAREAGPGGGRSAAEPLLEDRLPQLDKADAELASLEDRAQQSAGIASADADPSLRGKIDGDLKKTGSLADRSRALADGWGKTIDAVAVRELLRVENELVRIFEKARLGKVDSVIGEKRMLEKEIEEISADRYMPRTIGRVYQQGLISDTEEYWPPEEEIWEDEYQGWK